MTSLMAALMTSLMAAGLVLVLAAALTAGPVHAQAGESAAATGASGLPLPRFVSLKANPVNMRAGPGTDHRILWTFRRVGLPIEIIAEYEHWRKVRDFEGDEGWIYKDLLSGKRFGMIAGDEATLYRRADDQSPEVAQLQVGVIGELRSCEDGWCRFSVERYNGFVPAAALYGVHDGEHFD